MTRSYFLFLREKTGFNNYLQYHIFPAGFPHFADIPEHHFVVSVFQRCDIQDHINLISTVLHSAGSLHPFCPGTHLSQRETNYGTGLYSASPQFFSYKGCIK